MRCPNHKWFSILDHENIKMHKFVIMFLPNFTYYPQLPPCLNDTLPTPANLQSSSLVESVPRGGHAVLPCHTGIQTLMLHFVVPIVELSENFLQN